MPTAAGGRLHWGATANRQSPRRCAVIAPTVSTHASEPSTRSKRSSGPADPARPANVAGAFKEPHTNSVNACRVRDANIRAGAVTCIIADRKAD
jgi:hypothetical protein